MWSAHIGTLDNPLNDGQMDMSDVKRMDDSDDRGAFLSERQGVPSA